MNYVFHILILIGIYSVLAISLNLLAGYTGLISLCHAAFYGIGAYITALITLNFGLPWIATVPVCAVFSGIIAWIIGKVTLRFRGDLFVIVSFSFQVIIYGLMMNWTELTHGPMGLPGIPHPSFVGWQFNDNWQFLLMTTLFALCSFLFLHRLVTSPYGRCLKGIREDETFIASTGKSAPKFKTSAFVVGAVFAGLCGSIYAGYLSFIDPSSFDISESIFILTVVIIGGAGSLWGPIVGAALLVLLPELLRFIGLPDSIAANIRQIIYGGLLVLFVMWRPTGILGEYIFQSGEAKE
jgi:branched-chain amino acid transport system permease protein